MKFPVEQKSYDEIVDLLARGASTAEILAFRPSDKMQARVRDLLERNATDGLSGSGGAGMFWRVRTFHATNQNKSSRVVEHET